MNSITAHPTASDSPTPERPAAAGLPRTHYAAPGWLSRNLMNRLVRRLSRVGISV